MKYNVGIFDFGSELRVDHPYPEAFIFLVNLLGMYAAAEMR
jgi:hypothetical protein